MIRNIKYLILLLMQFPKVLSVLDPIQDGKPQLPVNETCFRLMVEHFFDPTRPFIIFNMPHLSVLKSFVKEVHTFQSFQGTYISKPQAIAFMDSIDDDVLNKLAKQFGSSRDGKLLIVALSRLVSIKRIEDHLLSFWKLNRNKVALAYVDTQEELKLLTDFSLEDKFLCSPKMHYHIYENFCETQTLKSKELWSGKGKEQLCKLETLQIPAETLAIHKEGNGIGITSKMVHTYSELRGVQLNIDHNDGIYLNEFLCEGYFSKLIESLENGRHDIATGPLFQNVMSDDIGYGPVIFKDNFIIAGKKVKDEVHGMYIIVFNSTVWQCWFTCFFLSTIFYYLLHILLEKPEKLSLSAATFNIFTLSIGVGLTKTPKSTPLRLFMALYIFASIIICTVYVGRISSILATDSLAAMTLNRVYSLLDLDFHFKYSAYLDYLIKITYYSQSRRRGSDLNVTDYFMRTNRTEWDNVRSILFEEETNFAVVSLKSVYLAHPSESELIDPFEPYQPFSWLITFYVSKHSPLINSVQFWTREFQEKGLVNKWFSDIREGNRNDTILIENDYVLLKNGPKAISLDSFGEFLIILLVEQAIALIVFILEHAFYRINKKYLIEHKIRYVMLLLKPPKGQ